jgi:tetratricopeptide (TPR) repeat protein
MKPKIDKRESTGMDPLIKVDKNIAAANEKSSFLWKTFLVSKRWCYSQVCKMGIADFFAFPRPKLVTEIITRSTSRISLMIFSSRDAQLGSNNREGSLYFDGAYSFYKRRKQSFTSLSEVFFLNRGCSSLVLFALSVFAGCSHVVVVKSEPPGARVRIVNANGKLGPSLGVTPLDLNSLPSDDAVLIEIDKDAHLPKQVVIPKVTGSRLTINTKLQPLSKEYLAERSRLDFASSLNANLFEIFKLQSLILEKNADEVLKMEKSMRDQWEGISLYQSLLGNFYYLTGDYKTAKTKYEKALSLDPRNDEARNMLSNLR